MRNIGDDARLFLPVGGTNAKRIFQKSDRQCRM